MRPRNRFIQLLASGSLVMLTQGAAPAAPVPDTYGLPAKHDGLPLVEFYEATHLTPVQRTEVLIIWLVREHQDPIPTGRGVGGGEITSGYRQVQLIAELADKGDALALRTLSVDRKIEPWLRDCVRLALSGMYDRSQASSLIRILKESKEGEFRADAAILLGVLRTREAIPVLEKALTDPYSAEAGNCFEGTWTAYPVREAAKKALGFIRSSDKNFIRQLDEAAALFEKNLKEARRSPQSHQLSAGFLTWVHSPPGGK